MIKISRNVVSAIALMAAIGGVAISNASAAPAHDATVPAASKASGETQFAGGDCRRIGVRYVCS